MNSELRKLVELAGAPKEVIDDLWFHIFCQNFAHIILSAAEEEIRK